MASGLTFSARASLRRVDGRGLRSPASSPQTVLRPIPASRARSSCDNPFASLNSRSNVAIPPIIAQMGNQTNTFSDLLAVLTMVKY